MGIHRPLMCIFARGGSVSRELPAAALLGRAVRGILILALALGSAGTVALAWPGHQGAGPARVSAHRAGSPGSSGTLAAMSSARGVPRPWIF